MAKIIDKVIARNVKPGKTRRIVKKPKPTFKSEVNALKAKAMTEAARKAEANKIAKKYGKSVDAVLRPKAELKAIKNRVQRNNKAK